MILVCHLYNLGSTNAHSVCSGSLEAFSLDADYRFNVHFDAYIGAMYSGTMGWPRLSRLTDQLQLDHGRALQVLGC